MSFWPDALHLEQRAPSTSLSSSRLFLPLPNALSSSSFLSPGLSPRPPCPPLPCCPSSASQLFQGSVDETHADSGEGPCLSYLVRPETNSGPQSPLGSQVPLLQTLPDPLSSLHFPTVLVPCCLIWPKRPAPQGKHFHVLFPCLGHLTQSSVLMHTCMCMHPYMSAHVHTHVHCFLSDVRAETSPITPFSSAAAVNYRQQEPQEK